jgi:hypothetical protein
VGLCVVLVAAIWSAGNGLGVPTSGAAFKDASWTPLLYTDLAGCARGVAENPHWSKASGVGRWTANLSARSCPPLRGGSSVASYADADAEISVLAPVHPPIGSGGVNTSWAVSMTATSAGFLTGSATCPIRTYSSSYDYGYTWFNYTSQEAVCTAEAEVYLFGSTSVDDLTSNAVDSSANGWVEPFNISGVIVDNYTVHGAYSNASYWSNNYSYSGNYTHSYGSSGGLSGTFRPVWFVNATFAPHHRYAVSTSLDLYAYLSVQGFANGRAHVVVDAASLGHGIVLRPFAVW